jgi:hypothetical protein
MQLLLSYRKILLSWQQHLPAGRNECTIWDCCCVVCNAGIDTRVLQDESLWDYAVNYSLYHTSIEQAMSEVCHVQEISQGVQVANCEQRHLAQCCYMQGTIYKQDCWYRVLQPSHSLLASLPVKILFFSQH